MDCKRVRDLMSEYLDGRLGSAATGPIRAHIESCAACRREEALLSGTWNLLGEYAPIEADVLGAVRRRVHSPVGRLLRIAAPLAAAAAVIIVVTMMVASPTAPPVIDDEVAVEVKKLPPEDRALLMDLAKEENRVLAENMDVIRALELVGADRLSEGRDPWNGH